MAHDHDSIQAEFEKLGKKISSMSPAGREKATAFIEGVLIGISMREGDDSDG